MRIPRVFVELPLRETAPVTLPPEPSRHLTRVLRLGAGDPVTLFDGTGRDFSGRLLSGAKTSVVVQIEALTEAEPPAELEVHLGIGISKGERMDLAIQKSVELGVAGIVPLFTKRSVVRLDGDRLEKRQRHWRGVLIAACEQSGRRRLPDLDAATSLERWLCRRHPFPLLLHHQSSTPLPAIDAPKEALTLLVGPEGGLAPDERSLAQQAGFTPVRLGPRVLRTETAPLAALAAAQALWGDFRD